MATSDRDIIITPNRGVGNDPKIQFKGGGTNAGSASTITMVALAKTAHEGVVQFHGTDGDTIAAFGEDNTGSLFSVTGDDGITKIEVNDTGVINASGSTGALGLPVGVSTARPDDPQAGYTRWNTTNSAMEIYNGSEWIEIIADYFPSGSTIFN